MSNQEFAVQAAVVVIGGTIIGLFACIFVAVLFMRRVGLWQELFRRPKPRGGVVPQRGPVIHTWDNPATDGKLAGLSREAEATADDGVLKERGALREDCQGCGARGG